LKLFFAIIRFSIILVNMEGAFGFQQSAVSFFPFTDC